MSKLKDRLESVSPNIRDDFNNYERFIEIIESIGFVLDRDRKFKILNIPEFILYKYSSSDKSVYIVINNNEWSVLAGSSWLRTVYSMEKCFQMNDLRLLEENFKSQMRDFKLNELLS